jgi:histidinol phosphatase-like PHP family hydrolase
MNVTLVCQGFNSGSLRLQPWRRVHEISKRVVKQGTSVTILTDGAAPNGVEEVIDGIKSLRLINLTLAPFTHRKKADGKHPADKP